MWKCPVCEEISNTMLCENCGFDGSRDYEHYPSFAPVGAAAKAISEQREIWNRQFADNLRCGSCGERRFVIGLSNGAIRCFNCGTEIGYDQIAALMIARKQSHDPAPQIPAEGCAVVATGNNGRGQCNVGTWKNIRAVAAGSVHTVGLRADGTAVAAGSNTSGQCNVESWRWIKAIAAGAVYEGDFWDFHMGKPVTKAHGSSDAKAFKSAIRLAMRFAESGATASIEAMLGDENAPGKE